MDMKCPRCGTTLNPHEYPLLDAMVLATNAVVEQIVEYLEARGCVTAARIVALQFMDSVGG